MKDSLQYRKEGNCSTLVEQYYKNRRNLETMLDTERLTLLTWLQYTGNATKKQILENFKPESKVSVLIDLLHETGHIGFVQTQTSEWYFITPRGLGMLRDIGIPIKANNVEDFVRLYEDSVKLLHILETKNLFEACLEMEGQSICMKALFGTREERYKLKNISGEKDM